MSVLDVEKVDGIGINANGEELVLLVTDHLDWSNEYEHLIQLQNKINSYITFIESGQYADVYSNYRFTSFCIEIHFKNEPVQNCIKFIDTVNKQLQDIKIAIKYVTI